MISLTRSRTMTISISLPIAAHAMVVQVRTVAELGGTRRNSAATRRNSHDHGTTTVRPRYDHDSACTLDAKIVRSQSRCCIFPTVVRADADFGTEGQVRKLGHHQENKDEYHLRCAAAPWSRRPSHFHLHQRYKRGRQVDTRRPLSSLVTPASALRRCAVGGLTSRALASAPGSSATARAVAGTVVLDGYSWSEPPCRTYRGVSVQGMCRQRSWSVRRTTREPLPCTQGAATRVIFLFSRFGHKSDFFTLSLFRPSYSAIASGSAAGG